MILSYFLCLKIIANHEIQIKNQIKQKVLASCSNLVDHNEVKNNLDTDTIDDALCSGNTKLIRCKFGRFKVVGELYQNPLFYVQRNNFYCEYCSFFEILLNRAIVSTGIDPTTNLNNNLTIYHTTITDCYADEYIGHYIYTLSGYVLIDNLTTYSDENLQSGRALYINAHKECNILNCKLENQYHQQTSGILINCSNKGAINLLNCTFINLRSIQTEATMLKFYDVVDDLIIENCTFEKTISLDDTGCESYFIYIGTVSNDHKLTFKNCLFSNLETDSCCGGGIGLKYINNDYLTVNLIFEKTVFEKIKNGNFSGGVIKIHDNSGCNDKNCHLTILNCVFEDIFSVEFGGAIYFNSPNHKITIKETTFNRTKCEKQGHSLYIVNNNDNDVVISNCDFFDCGIESNGFVIFVDVKSTTIENCQIEFTNSIGCGGIFINCNGTIILNNNKLIKISSDDSALKINSFEKSNFINISECIFDQCEGNNYSCFEINIMTDSFNFKNILISNSKRYHCNNYSGIINCNNEINTLNLNNISFINNSYSSLYGGGVGIMIVNANKLFFIDCCFFNNEARHDLSINRPTEPTKNNYNNGDGGGIQIGYHCDTSYIDVTFDNCTFKNNRAERHGGALAIQTLGKVEIINCQFYNNEANFDFKSSSSMLLVENHFDKKSEGRGGAIYINPTYTYEDEAQHCSPPNKIMTDVLIKDCDFELNTGYDGYAIYVEGDDLGTVFNIENNNFVDNYNLSNSGDNSSIINGAVIVTEIHSIQLSEDPSKQNNFSSSKNIQFNEILYVDHYGNTPSIVFTYSQYFSHSNYFSNSKLFSESNFFSETSDFTFSKVFSISKNIDDSQTFSNSIFFSISNYFSRSSYFSKTKLFSKSLHFSETKDFTNSKFFSNSDDFGRTKKFSKSSCFTKSKVFSNSFLFSISSYFSKSNCFMPTEDLKKSNHFTEFFSKTSIFTETQFFSETNYFSKSEIFIKTSNFTSGNFFSQSSTLFHSPYLSKISSLQFTKSEIFSNSMNYTENDFFDSDFTYSLTISITFLKRISVSYSISYSSSNSFLLSYINEYGTYSILLSNSNYQFYFPYIIYYYSPSYQPTYILIPFEKKKKLTQEQLIGICCGSAAIFFFILAVIILALKKKYKVKDYLLDFSISSDEKNIIKKDDENLVDENNIDEKENDYDSDYNLNFWI